MITLMAVFFGGFLLGLFIMALMSMASRNTRDQEIFEQAQASYERCLTATEKERERHATL